MILKTKIKIKNTQMFLLLEQLSDESIVMEAILLVQNQISNTINQNKLSLENTHKKNCIT